MVVLSNVSKSELCLMEMLIFQTILTSVRRFSNVSMSRYSYLPQGDVFIHIPDPKLKEIDNRYINK